MLYKEIIGSLFYSKSHMEYVKTLVGEMQIFVILGQVVHVVTTGPKRVKRTGPSDIFCSTTYI